MYFYKSELMGINIYGEENFEFWFSTIPFIFLSYLVIQRILFVCVFVHYLLRTYSANFDLHSVNRSVFAQLRAYGGFHWPRGHRLTLVTQLLFLTYKNFFFNFFRKFIKSNEKLDVIIHWPNSIWTNGGGAVSCQSLRFSSWLFIVKLCGPYVRLSIAPKVLSGFLRN